MRGEGKTTYTFSVSVNILSANILFCVVPAGGEGGSGAEMERKFVGVSRKRIRDFTPPLFIILTKNETKITTKPQITLKYDLLYKS
jgi:hypothetical protein